MEKQNNILFEAIKDLTNKQILSWLSGFIVVGFGVAFTIGGYVIKQTYQSNKVNCLVVSVDSLRADHNNLTYNVKKIADFLGRNGDIPYNLTKLDSKQPKEVVMCDSRIPKKRKEQRITVKETAIDNKENIENIILE